MRLNNVISRCCWRLLPLFFLAGLTPLAVKGAPPTRSLDRPNVLWITVEDMSPTLGCWGDTYAVTPNIDRLAARSIQYSNVFATAPVCSPVRSCLITGCYATSLGTQRLRSEFPIPDTMRGFPSLLRSRGYYCTNNVKTDYNTANAAKIIAESWDQCSDQAHWRGRRPDQPFFAVFNDMTTHQSRTMVNPYDWFVEHVQSRLDSADVHDPAGAPVPPYYPDTPEVRKTIARFYDCVSVMDMNVGRILSELEEDGLADDTIIFFFSDHGSGMPRHKRLLLDSGMRVPLLVFFPPKYRQLAGRPGVGRDERLVSFVDFPRTVLGLCGAPVPDWMQGRSFLGRPAEAPRQYVFGARDRVDEAFDLARSVRDHQYLYIRNFMPHRSYNQPSFYSDQGTIRQEITRLARTQYDKLTSAQQHYAGPKRPIEELYDCIADPLNLNNLAASGQHTEVKVRLRQRLDRWILEQPDMGFLPESEVWARLNGRVPRELGTDVNDYPLSKLFAAASLVGAGEQELPKLLRNLNDPEAGVRYWAAMGLGALGSQAAPAETAIAAALSDPSAAVRIEAAGALAGVGQTRRALQVLVRELKNDDLDAVLHAARTIELMGESGRGATAAMQAARRQAEGPGDRKMFIRFATDGFLQQLRAN